jgi:HemK-related putative methylase
MIEYKGLMINTSERVYAPSDDSFLAAKAIERIIARFSCTKVLDMGTGTGFLGIAAASCMKIGEVHFADINGDAVALARDNFSLNRDNFKKIRGKFINTDLFSRIGGKFDFIMFNAPYLRSEDGDAANCISLAWNGGMTGIELSVRFLEKAKYHVRKRGHVLLVASSLSDISGLKKAIRSLGYTINGRSKVHIFFEDIVCFVLSQA